MSKSRLYLALALLLASQPAAPFAVTDPLKLRLSKPSRTRNEDALCKPGHTTGLRLGKWTAALGRLGGSALGIIGGGVATLALAGPKLWQRLPRKLPTWWLAHSDFSGGVAESALFLVSNVAYVFAGATLLAQGAPPILGQLVLAVSGASVLYHAAQCKDGCESVSAARWCTVDSLLAVGTGSYFVLRCGVDASSLFLGLLSGAFFLDAFRLGYTTSHSLWHLSTAAAAMTSGQRLVARRA